MLKATIADANISLSFPKDAVFKLSATEVKCVIVYEIL